MGRFAWSNHIYFQITQPGSSTDTNRGGFISSFLSHPHRSNHLFIFCPMIFQFFVLVCSLPYLSSLAIELPYTLLFCPFVVTVHLNTSQYERWFIFLKAPIVTKKNLLMFSQRNDLIFVNCLWRFFSFSSCIWTLISNWYRRRKEDEMAFHKLLLLGIE